MRPLTVTGGKLESGCYYLTDDLALEEPSALPQNGAQVTLCLNGHTLRLADGAEGCIIFVAVSDKDAEPSVLTITDCNGADSSSNYYVDEDGALVFDDRQLCLAGGLYRGKRKERACRWPDHRRNSRRDQRGRL